MSRVTHVYGSCHTHEFVTSQEFAPHTVAVGREWVMSHVDKSCHICMSHVTHMYGSCHAHEFVTPQEFAPGTENGSCHTCMSHATYV